MENVNEWAHFDLQVVVFSNTLNNIIIIVHIFHNLVKFIVQNIFLNVVKG